MTPTPLNPRITRYLPIFGQVGYDCDPVPGATGATRYTWRRNGAILQTAGSTSVWDWSLYPPDSHTVTVSSSLIGDHSDESPESAPFQVSMPPAKPPAGGELLFLCVSFADHEYPASIDVTPYVLAATDFIKAASGGKTVLTPTIMRVALSGVEADYTSGMWVDSAKINAELVDMLQLRTRPNLRRVGIDLAPPRTTQDYAGGLMWDDGGDFFDRDRVWSSFVTAGNVTHEIFHTWGMTHLHWIYGAPADPDTVVSPAGDIYSGEIMGSPDLTPWMNFTQRLLPGWRLPSQMVIAPPYGGTWTVTPVEANGPLQAIVVRCSAAGSHYVIEHNHGQPQAYFRPYKALGTMQLAHITPVVNAPVGQLLVDSVRGIKVTYSGFSASGGMTVNVTTPIPKPVTNGGGTGTGGTGGGHGHGHGRTK